MPVLPVEDYVERLRRLYVDLRRRRFHHISELSHISKVPYETLRHFLESDKHLRCPANEEKLARALGHDSIFFRRLVRRYARCADWDLRCLSVVMERAVA